MIYCLDRDFYFFNHILSKANIPFTQTNDPKGSVLLLHTPYPWDVTWVESANKLIKKAKDVIVFSTELHPPTVDWLHTLPKKAHVYLCGRIHNMKAKQYPYMDWFATTTHFYKKRLHILEELHNKEPLGDNLVHFNALLGRKKQHRDLIYKCVYKNKQVLSTYIRSETTIDEAVLDKSQFIWEGQPQPVNYTIDNIEYDGEQVSLSKVVQIDVYKKTNWCIVAETNYQSEFVFFTEKIAKPIMAKMPFIIVGNPFSLQVLHYLGFKTFDGIIDEGYDKITNLYSRVDRIASLIDNLTHDPEVPQQILDHNYDVMMNTDWQDTKSMKTLFEDALAKSD